MKSKLFKTLFTGVVAGALALGAGTQAYAAPLMQDQDTQKPSPSISPEPEQVPPPPEQSAPQDSAPPSQDQDQAAPPVQGPAPNQRQYSPLSADQLHQLVAPIALYPDALVAQILAASAYPTQIVQAHRFVQENPDLKGRALGDAIDQQDWDPSVKALCQFPSVLANLDRDLSWTQELGDANYNQSADVMQAIQDMRHKAKEAGNLKTTPQQRVYDRDDQVEIEPADPDVVYVPQYNPTLVYGYPVGYWPGFYPWWGFGGPYISFGFGFPISPFFGFGWGWHGWGLGWGFHGGVFFGGHPYAFRSGAFYNRNAFVHGNYRGYARGGFAGRGFAGGRAYGSGAGRGYAARGYAGSARGYAGGRGYPGSAGNRGYAGGRGYEGSRGSTAPHSSGSSGHSAGGHSSQGGGHSSGGHSDGGHSGGGGHGSSGHGH